MAQKENTLQNFKEFFPNDVSQDLLKHLSLIFTTLKSGLHRLYVLQWVSNRIQELRKKNIIIDRFFEGKERVLEN